MATVVPTMATGSMASPKTTMAAAMITTRLTVLPTCVEINQCVGCTDNSSLSHLSVMTRPSWLGRAVGGRHRHERAVNFDFHTVADR